MPILCCPVCKDGRLQFEIHRDMQGVECWAREVETVELVEQSCDCKLTREDLESLETRASEIGDDWEPVEDFDFSDLDGVKFE
jgi:uncharacterized protein YbaR (Trm112 family)